MSPPMKPVAPVLTAVSLPVRLVVRMNSLRKDSGGRDRQHLFLAGLVVATSICRASVGHGVNLWCPLKTELDDRDVYIYIYIQRRPTKNTAESYVCKMSSDRLPIMSTHLDSESPCSNGSTGFACLHQTFENDNTRLPSIYVIG